MRTNFGAFLVDGGRVEVVDLPICLRTDRMRERSGILDELRAAKRANIGDAFDGPRTHVGGKFLIAEYGEPFLQAKLKPVAAGDAVASPVVKVFVRDHGLDMRVVGIGRGLGTGKHIFVVEDVESFVLHGAHVEIGNGDDHEDVEIVFAAKDGLIPPHGSLERIHRVAAAVSPCHARHRSAASRCVPTS